MKHEVYISVDVESAGPIPGKFSLLSIGACLVENPSISFYVELKPINSNFIKEALEVSSFDLDDLARTGVEPLEAMRAFGEWISSNADEHKPVFVGFNGCYDWQFVNWYFHAFLSTNPFGFGGVDIKSYYMGLRDKDWSESTSSQLPDEFKPESRQTHNALEDAIAQASIFSKMREFASKL